MIGQAGRQLRKMTTAAAPFTVTGRSAFPATAPAPRTSAVACGRARPRCPASRHHGRPPVRPHPELHRTRQPARQPGHRLRGLPRHAPRGAKRAGEAEQRLNTVAAWRESGDFSEAEKAALALAEAVTRLADRPGPVPDEVFAAAAKHYDEAALAALLTHDASINVWNPLNVATAQRAGEWTAQWVSQEG